MKSAIRIGLAVTVCSIATLGCITAARQPIDTQAPRPESKVDVKEAFEEGDFDVVYKWFDSLDFGAVRTGQFLRLQLGDSQNPTYEYGFLASQPGQPVNALTIGLRTLSEGTSWSAISHFESADFEDYAKAELPIAQNNDPFGPNNLVGSARFVIARACDARGLHVLAKDYLASIRTNESHMVGGRQIDDDDVGDQIAAEQYSDLVWSFRDPAIGWDAQLANAERLSRLFGDSIEKAEIRDTTKVLRTMVKLVPPPEGKNSDVDRLIQQLQDEAPMQAVHPGRPEVFGPFGEYGIEGSPAHQLARIGQRAVPKLIDALSDRRYTHGDWPGQFRVGDIAIQVLEAIGGGMIGHHPVPLTPASIPQLKNDARARFARVAQIGELAELTRQLFDDPTGQAISALAQRYPKEAVGVFDKALRTLSATDNRREAILFELGALRGPASIALLEKEAANGPSVRSRMTAAERLGPLAPSVAANDMIREWKRFNGPDATSNNQMYDMGPYVREGFVSPMIMLKDGRAIRCLTDGLARRPAPFRNEVVLRLLDLVNIYPTAFRTLHSGSILAAELDDTGRGTDLNWRLVKLNNAEIGDMAAVGLWLAYPDKYVFKSYSSKSQMRQQRGEFKNIWKSGSVKKITTK